MLITPFLHRTLHKVVYMTQCKMVLLMKLILLMCVGYIRLFMALNKHSTHGTMSWKNFYMILDLPTTSLVPLSSRTTQNGSLFYFLIYADDLIVTSSSQSLVQQFIYSLFTQFSIKDLGNLHYFLNIKVLPTSQGMFLTQHKYIGESSWQKQIWMVLKRLSLLCWPQNISSSW